jgi:hypothetical protein
MALARVAESVAGQMPGVALSGDHRWVTAERGDAVRGAVAVALGDGVYELELHVVVAWPPEPLAQLADDLRRRVRDGAESAGLADNLGAIQVRVDGVEESDASETSEGSG